MKAAFWLGWWAVLLLLPADLAQAQVQSHVPMTGRPLLLWDRPPVIGMYSIDSARVTDALPAIASADWPAFTDTVVAELRACTRINGGLDGWSLRTVSAGLFYVRTYDRALRTWREDEPYIGFTFPTVRRIYVVQNGLYVRGLVKHELLHALLADRGFDPRHGTPVADALFKRCVKERTQ